jgi:hypothetical protein
MFFAAFEKKWWKSSSSEKNDSESGNLNEISEERLEESEDKFNLVNKENLDNYKDLNSDLEDRSDEDEEEEEEEVFTNSDEYEQVDPHAPPAFDFDESFDEPKDLRKQSNNLRVGSAKEFFSTEILYRYDILEQFDRDAIRGNYSIELYGHETGTWSITLDKDILVRSEKKESEVLLRIDSDDFLSIVNGKINSQIALVSKRVEVIGNTKKASLLQNILAPRND